MMKKSEIYNLALIAVVNSRDFGCLNKLEVLEALFEDRKLAVWREEQEAALEADKAAYNTITTEGKA
jgi:hypothetical protein